MSLESTTSASPASAARSGRVDAPQRSTTGIGESRATSSSTSGRSSGAPRANRPAPRDSTARRATSAKWLGGQRFVSQRAPRLSPSRGRRHPDQRLSRPGAVRLARWRSRIGPGDLGAEGRGDREEPIDGMRVVESTGRNDPVRIKPTRAFARIREADAHGRARRGGHESRTKQPLKVDRQVKPPTPERAEEAAKTVQSSGVQPCFGAIVDDHPIDLGMTLDQSSQILVDDPGERRAWPVLPERSEAREGIDHITQRARLDEADAPGAQSPQLRRIGGRVFRHCQ